MPLCGKQERLFYKQQTREECMYSVSYIHVRIVHTSCFSQSQVRCSIYNWNGYVSKPTKLNDEIHDVIKISREEPKEKSAPEGHPSSEKKNRTAL